MKKFRYIILLFLCYAGVCQAQPFTVAHDSLSGSAFQCYSPANEWRGGGSYGTLQDNISFTGAPTPINWSIVASNFPADWLPNFLINDTAGYHYNTTLTLWNGSVGSTQRVSYPASGSYFNFYLYESALRTSGTYWLEVNLKDSLSSFSQNIWFIITRDAGSLGDSIAGPVNVCPGGSIILADLLATPAWSLSNASATITDSFVTGVVGGLDTVTDSGTIYVYSGPDTCSFHPIVMKIISVYASPSPTVSATASLELYIPAIYDSYQWLFSSSPISGANGPSYMPPINGMYAVIVTDNNGCTGISAPFFEEYLSVPNVAGTASNIRVFPNPATDEVNIQAPLPVNVTVSSLTGGTLIYRKRTNQVDISSLPNGEYLLEITDAENGGKLQSTKLVKEGK